MLYILGLTTHPYSKPNGVQACNGIYVSSLMSLHILSSIHAIPSFGITRYVLQLGVCVSVGGHAAD